MLKLKNEATEETKMLASEQESGELSEQELENAAGGLNPQPLPPIVRFKS